MGRNVFVHQTGEEMTNRQQWWNLAKSKYVFHGIWYVWVLFPILANKRSSPSVLLSTHQDCKDQLF